MAADELKQTSEQQMRRLQFNDKVSRLNREFIRQLQEWYKQCAHYDFSNSVKSYLGHIKRLDEMYSGKTVTKAVSNTSPSSGRKIAKAKRRVGEAAKNNELNTSVNVSTPSGAPPRFTLGGDVSAIKPNTDVTLTVPASGPENSKSGCGSRKRAIRGGGPDGGAEIVLFRGTDSSGVSSVKAPLTTAAIPKPPPGFWSSQKRDVDSNGSAPVSIPKSELPSKEQDKSHVPVITSGSTQASSGNGDPEKKSTLSFTKFGENNDESSSKKPTLSFPKFGENKDEDSSKKPALSFPKFGENKDEDSSKKPTLSFPKFGENKDEDSSKKPTLSFSKFGENKDEDSSKKSTLSFPKFGENKDYSSKKSPLSFPRFGENKDQDSSKKSLLSFPKFGESKDEDGSKKPVFPFTSFSTTKDKEDGDKNKSAVPLFGNTTSDSASSGGLKFSFGTLPKSRTEGEKQEENEEEYVPPKAEVVENEEADAFFSTKCSVFKLIDKQYSKVGIGMLHLKEVDGKKSVLVRAATAIGTVWINALMNKAMKVAKFDEKGEKIRLSYPANEKEMSTYIIRFPSTKEASRVLEDIEAATK